LLPVTLNTRYWKIHSSEHNNRCPNDIGSRAGRLSIGPARAATHSINEVMGTPDIEAAGAIE
jgi:hypothetical protein